MEKLLNLLNEYAPDYCKDYPDDTIMDEIVISKRFGFIKWLVDNDKIDESKIEIHWFSFYESVLMELAIQDAPIEFLISILK